MASDTVMVGGAAMYPSKNIIENAVNSKDHTTLVAAVNASGPIPRWTNSPLDKFNAKRRRCWCRRCHAWKPSLYPARRVAHSDRRTPPTQPWSQPPP
jgi:hypothetical protein